jgi:hypothetical protein
MASTQVSSTLDNVACFYNLIKYWRAAPARVFFRAIVEIPERSEESVVIMFDLA